MVSFVDARRFKVLAQNFEKQLVAADKCLSQKSKFCKPQDTLVKKGQFQEHANLTLYPTYLSGLKIAVQKVNLELVALINILLSLKNRAISNFKRC